MSRRAVILVMVFFGVLLASNIVILGLLSVWLPIWKSRVANLQSSNRTTVALLATPSQPNNTPLAPAGVTAPSSDLVMERQFTSPSGNLRIKYVRDRKTKIPGLRWRTHIGLVSRPFYVSQNSLFGH